MESAIQSLKLNFVNLSTLTRQPSDLEQKLVEMSDLYSDEIKVRLRIPQQQQQQRFSTPVLIWNGDWKCFSKVLYMGVALQCGLVGFCYTAKTVRQVITAKVYDDILRMCGSWG